MKAVIQRVKWCKVKSEGKIITDIATGMLVLLGIENSDNTNDTNWLSSKIANIRIFNDIEGKINLDLNSINGEIIIVSQFTLHASTAKGNRPSFINSAKPDIAENLYLEFVKKIQLQINSKIKTGIFRADMQIELCNDGPVTIIIDSKNRV